jgi:ubiquinone/menaquinone biosynthesis C-methylase UbiE
MHPVVKGTVQMDGETIEEYWSRFPDTYDQNQEYVVGRELLDDMAGELHQLAELGDVLEFGCGTGYFTATIAENSTSLLATDLSESLLEAAKTRLRDHPNVAFQNENCMESSFEPESFDSVFMANLIHVVENPGNALRESHRILRGGGRIVIVTFTGYGMSLWEKIKMGVRYVKAWGKPPAHAHSFSSENVESMLGEAGFVVEQSKLVGNRTKALFLVGVKS